MAMDSPRNCVDVTEIGEFEFIMWPRSVPFIGKVKLLLKHVFIFYEEYAIVNYFTLYHSLHNYRIET